jgi:hypothetical protein
MAMPTFGDAAGGANESDEVERCRQSRGSRLEARIIPLTWRRRARKSASRQKFMKQHARTVDAGHTSAKCSDTASDGEEKLDARIRRPGEIG